MKGTERTTPNGLRTEITDNARAGRFEASIDGHLVGWQPYRRYGSHFVLMRTEVDEQWRTQGISSAMIDGILGMIGVTGATVIPRCKVAGDYIYRHPEYLDLVTEQYRALLQPISRPAVNPASSEPEYGHGT
jgi:predicted GNAT family acetyltransferase